MFPTTLFFLLFYLSLALSSPLSLLTAMWLTLLLFWLWDCLYVISDPKVSAEWRWVWVSKGQETHILWWRFRSKLILWMPFHACYLLLLLFFFLQLTSLHFTLVFTFCGKQRTRQTLNEKISQLNSAIDNVSSRLRGGNNSPTVAVETDPEVEATMWDRDAFSFAKSFLEERRDGYVTQLLSCFLDFAWRLFQFQNLVSYSSIDEEAPLLVFNSPAAILTFFLNIFQCFTHTLKHKMVLPWFCFEFPWISCIMVLQNLWLGSQVHKSLKAL